MSWQISTFIAGLFKRVDFKRIGFDKNCRVGRGEGNNTEEA